MLCAIYGPLCNSKMQKEKKMGKKSLNVKLFSNCIFGLSYLITAVRPGLTYPGIIIFIVPPYYCLYEFLESSTCIVIDRMSIFLKWLLCKILPGVNAIKRELDSITHFTFFSNCTAAKKYKNQNCDHYQMIKTLFEF